MHEFGIAQGLLDTVLAKAGETNSKRVECIKLEIGILCGVEVEALTFAFNCLSEGTPAAKAKLEIEHIPLRCHCDQCSQLFLCKPFSYHCPNCGTTSRSIRTGREMNMISMEVS